MRPLPLKLSRDARQGVSPRLVYFRKRAIRPPASEPKPSRPSSGSGEAVCGSLPPLLLACAVSVPWALSLAEVPAAAVWSDEVWPTEEVALCSDVLGVVLVAADWLLSVAVVLLALELGAAFGSVAAVP